MDIDTEERLLFRVEQMVASFRDETAMDSTDGVPDVTVTGYDWGMQDCLLSITKETDDFFCEKITKNSTNDTMGMVMAPNEWGMIGCDHAWGISEASYELGMIEGVSDNSWGMIEESLHKTSIVHQQSGGLDLIGSSRGLVGSQGKHDDNVWGMIEESPHNKNMVHTSVAHHIQGGGLDVIGSSDWGMIEESPHNTSMVHQEQAGGLDVIGSSGWGLIEESPRNKSMVHTSMAPHIQVGGLDVIDSSSGLVDSQWQHGSEYQDQDVLLLRNGLYDPQWLPQSGKRGTSLDRSDDVMGIAENDSVSRESLHKLRPGTWLNDEVIHYYFVLLRLRDAKNCNEHSGGRRSHFFKSFFLTKLLIDDKKYNYDSVKRWSNKVPGKDIFALDKVIFAVNISQQHWGCAAVFMQSKRIQFYDSMHGDGMFWLNGIFKYLQDEHLHKKKVPLPNKDEWKLIPCQDSCPMQENGYDCGVFTCAFADFLSSGKEVRFDQSYVTELRNRIALSILKGNTQL